MANFIRQLNAAGKSVVVSFIRSSTESGTRYFIMIEDDTVSYYFMMDNYSGEWNINLSPKLPSWIHEIKLLLISSILENESRL